MSGVSEERAVSTTLESIRGGGVWDRAGIVVSGKPLSALPLYPPSTPDERRDDV